MSIFMSHDAQDEAIGKTGIQDFFRLISDAFLLHYLCFIAPLGLFDLKKKVSAKIAFLVVCGHGWFQYL